MIMQLDIPTRLYLAKNKDISDFTAVKCNKCELYYAADLKHRCEFRCKHCKWLDMEKKTSVGYECTNPLKEHRTRVSHLKQPTTPACKLFERGKSNEEVCKADNNTN